MQRNLQKEQEISIAISDTSPLIALKHAGLLEELNLLFQGITVPPSVMRELSVKREGVFPGLRFSIRRGAS